MDGSERTAANLLLDVVLIDLMLRSSIILAGGVF
jgi:hypothetical protein